ncbi:MAG: deoxyribodipyrimidine photo-lyase [Marinobacter sp.]|uniref:deoxyribodipyrimidine photo-lyase n=1 Tax=Marinobacter sp. TaxID=50741 RepID=UPI00299DEDE6|nr:deoxyribodipyrimidine photo-lyase [Marinobacter sp.]MDX1633509.1 deoxyribodipyrimidine photo-lyase [Marinobacter sp.]
MTQLVWFRNDLRTADNAALTAACKQGGPVRACFIVTPGQWREHDWSPARLRFVVDHLNSLSRFLAELGIATDILDADRFSDSLPLLRDLCRQHGVRQIHFNEEFGVNERRRDRQVRDGLADDGIKVNKYRDQTVAPAGSILTQQDEPYSVFTPFSRSWRQWADEHQPGLYPVPTPVADAVRPVELATTLAGYDEAPEPLVPVGEKAAQQRLEHFLDEDAADYKKLRDFPAVKATSRLSPYLANGVLSGRQCWLAVNQRMQAGGSSEGLFTWLTEIAWRDFYINILYHYPRVSMHRAFKPETEALEWNQPGENFEAWKAGQTGVPIVDAAMRQLNQTGWMHNRLRMVTAMFLTKNLFVDWRLGEAYFMSKLVDGFLASNNGGWQWSASTGTDAAPYFRVFNPATQSERFDPKGEFIRRYVPELESLDAKRIHQPWTGGVIPKGYPRPIVDLKDSRKAAIEKFQALKKD